MLHIIFCIFLFNKNHVMFIINSVLLNIKKMSNKNMCKQVRFNLEKNRHSRHTISMQNPLNFSAFSSDDPLKA
jgi:hypothetical protein